MVSVKSAAVASDSELWAMAAVMSATVSMGLAAFAWDYVSATVALSVRSTAAASSVVARISPRDSTTVEMPAARRLY